MRADVFDNRRCELGEGPLWHPERQQLFWFDILGMQLMTRTGDAPRRWQFEEYVSAAGWVDRDTLLIASETQLFRFDLETHDAVRICDLEADIPETRSNDGRADRQGGFWIGTMGKRAEEGRGAIYRWYRGELRKLVDGITIPNAICFTPDGSGAYYACSHQRKVYRLALDGDGWPKGEAEIWLDLSSGDRVPDGAVTDEKGNLWIAHWGGFCVGAYDSGGAHLQDIAFPARHCSCPAFGGADLSTLFCTSALEALDPEEAARSENGMTFFAEVGATGLPEPKVEL